MTPPLLSPPESTHNDLAPAGSVEQLGEAIAGIAAGLHAATYQLLVLLREFDARNGWTNAFMSCAHWLSWRTSIDMGAAREKVRVARALPELPLLSGALQRGEISYAKVRALTRIATRANEERLLAVAYHRTAAQVERLVRAWRRCDRVEEGRKHLSRAVSTYVDEDGMLVLRARLTPEQGAVVHQALEAASERLYHESREAAAPDNIEEEVTSGQRRADALALIAECAVRADLDRGSAGDRYQVVLHVDAHAAERNSAPGILELADGGIGVSAETSRRLSCDASVVVMREDTDGSVLDVGRKTRTIPTPIRRALTVRDGRCVFPGCTARRCDAHHLVHWADGGPTALDNLVLLCRRHHTVVHDQGFGVSRSANGDVVFRRPDGRPIETSPRTTWNGGQLLRNSVKPQSLRCWDGTPFNVAYAIDVLHERANPSRSTA